MNAIDAIGALLALAAGVSLYLLPVIVLNRRNVQDKGVVAVVNILLGWTVIGWIVALALACRTVRE